MRACRHCGKENGDDALTCSECGLDLGDSAFHRVASQALEQSNSFFRWRPTSIVLIVLVVLYGGFAILNLWMGSVLAQRGDQQTARILRSGAFWNAIVAVLCFVGRRMMGCQTRLRLLAGALAVVAAHLVVMRTWIFGLLNGQNPFPVVEALLIWPLFFYAIFWAYRESKRHPAA